jgi:mycothiol synthase
VRYTPAVCLAQSLGFDQYTTGWNMTVDLAAPQDAEAEERLAGQGITVRRAGPDDVEPLRRMAGDEFGGGWPWEVTESIERGLAGQAAGCHLALRDGEIIGFAAYGALRPSLFGPMGTLAAARGTGIGTVLLRRCLADQRAAGMRTAQIGWAGPIAFYSRTLGARIERVFLMFRKQLPPAQ